MKRSISLKKRLFILSFSIIVPLLIMVISVLVLLRGFTESYSQIVTNITEANEYNVNFEKEMNYAVYRVVIGSISLDDLKEGDILDGKDVRYATLVKNPYGMIDDAREHFESMRETVTADDSTFQIKGILSCLNTLENVLMKIEKNLGTPSNYSDNQSMWENDVHGVTSLIQNYIQKYIYYETLSLERLKNTIEQETAQAISISILLLVGIVGIVFWTSRRTIRSVTVPINALCDAARQMEKGDFSAEPPIPSDDEIQILVHRFDRMRYKIANLVEDIKTEQMKLKDTELKLLQEQINPHFLYNTLDTIVWLAEDGQDKEVIAMTTSLSEFFRTVLSGGRDYITIREEETHIQSYLNIQHFRYEDILDYEISIDESLYGYSILKLTLQPLVENALYHGIKNKRGKGIININGFEDGDDIVFEVCDNGIGMTEEELISLRQKIKQKSSNENSGFGLINVEERIRMNYGYRYGLEFESRKGEGTKVTVRIPKKN
ncbi:sensor histidine kinase [Ruminococcus sp. 5_1_39BFAA]|uniref:sensor histidine kinase n=1 Tax=Ruminococcus sp. 5_1_39BFAA TaxID=457412 RepID=UPI00356AB052